jgi:hypothetical protein
LLTLAHCPPDSPRHHYPSCPQHVIDGPGATLKPEPHRDPRGHGCMHCKAFDSCCGLMEVNGGGLYPGAWCACLRSSHSVQLHLTPLSQYPIKPPQLQAKAAQPEAGNSAFASHTIHTQTHPTPAPQLQLLKGDPGPSYTLSPGANLTLSTHTHHTTHTHTSHAAPHQSEPPCAKQPHITPLSSFIPGVLPWGTK